MSIKPIHGRIIIKPHKLEEETSGGIIIANPKEEGIIKGDVVAVGPGDYDEKGKLELPGVEPGDIVLLHTMAGDKFTYEDVTYQSIVNNEIIAVLT